MSEYIDMPNYNFDVDLPIAEKTEKQVCEFLEQHGKLKFLGDCKTNAYDLKMQTDKGNIITIEVKEDFTCQRTGNVGVEFECRGKPSGIEVSKADLYLYKVHEPDGNKRLYVIKTSKLKEMIRDEKYFRIVSGGDPGSNSMNYLFKLHVIQEHFSKLGRVPW
jgi:hypothetical protein